MTQVPIGVLIRTFFVQALWNYPTLIGAGFAWGLEPALRKIYAGKPDQFADALQRHAGLFNSHPYLVPLAAGAVARLEADGADAAQIERFKAALRGPLGAIGDSLVWQTWRPATALLGLAVLLAGAPWWMAAGAFLVVYNLLHLAIRIWGIRLGWRAGRNVAAELRNGPWEPIRHWAARSGALLSGAVPMLLAARFAAGPADWLCFAVAGAVAFRFAPVAERALPALLVVVAVGLLAWDTLP